MTSKVIVRLEDDIDGGDAAETVKFAIDGIEYEIDLSERNANRLRNSLSEFVSHGRKVGGRRRSSSRPFDGVDNKSVRKWAEANGIQLSKRGRIPADVIGQYQAAGN